MRSSICTGRERPARRSYAGPAFRPGRFGRRAGVLIIGGFGHCANPPGFEGDMLYNGDYNVLQWCGAGKWHAAGKVPGAGGAGCSDPGGVAGGLVFNSSYNVMQYCDGTYWRAIGK